MAEKYPVFDFGLCVCCHICAQACPVSAIALDVGGVDQWKNLYPGVNRKTCISCSLCMKKCPVDAITMAEPEAPEANREATSEAPAAPAAEREHDPR